MSEENKSNPFGDDFVIFEYGCEQAAEDGILNDVTDLAGIRGPGRWYVTTGVWSACEANKGNRTIEQAVVPFLRDVVAVVNAKIRLMQYAGPVTYACFMAECPLRLDDGNITGREVWISMNETGGMTIFFPEED